MEALQLGRTRFIDVMLEFNGKIAVTDGQLCNGRNYTNKSSCQLDNSM